MCTRYATLREPPLKASRFNRHRELKVIGGSSICESFLICFLRASPILFSVGRVQNARRRNVETKDGVSERIRNEGRIFYFLIRIFN